MKEKAKAVKEQKELDMCIYAELGKGSFKEVLCFGKHIKRRSYLRNVKDFLRKK